MYRDLLAELLDSEMEKGKSDENFMNFGGDSDGSVSINKGAVIVKDPRGNGKLPSLTPCEGLRLIVNEKEYKQSLFISEKDKIRIETLEEEHSGGFDIVISGDKLSASITLSVAQVIKYTPKDNNPEVNVNLRAEKSCLNKGWSFTLEEVLEQLQKENIVFGLEYAALQSKLELLEDITFVVAKGISPTESKDEVVEILFSNETNYILSQSNVTNRDNTFSVDKGTILAVKHPGRLGIPGTSVTGETILPHDPQLITLKVGMGVELIDNGSRAIANIDGEPKVESTGKLIKISVDPLLVHKGNLNITTGNIKFKGNVKVTGNVEDYAIVDATESITILGNVDGTRVFAGRHINVKEKVITGIIRAGGIGAYCGRLLPLLKDLLETFKDMRNAIQQLVENVVSSGTKIDEDFFARLVFLLKERKFSYVDKDIKKIVELIAETEVQVPDEFKSLAEQFNTEFLGANCLRLKDIKAFDQCFENLKLAKAIAQKLAEQKSNITIDYAQNSKINASGDVYVSGQGCFSTVIYSGGETKINGVFRGGQIYANGNVFIDEIGTEAGTVTQIVVPRNKVISINTAYEDVHIRIGNIRYRFTQAMINVLIRLDSQGKLSVKGIPINSEEDKEVIPKGLSK